MNYELNTLATLMHARAVAAGWWDDSPSRWSRYELATQLASSELAEAMEGHRKDLMDDHLPHLPMFDVELADFAIRQLDLAGALKIDVDIDIHACNDAVEAMRDRTIPAQLGQINAALFANVWPFSYSNPEQFVMRKNVRRSLLFAFACAEVNSIDLRDVIMAKSEYNLPRADHKLENRAKPGGKKF